MADANIGINVDGYQGDPNLAFGAGYAGGAPLQIDFTNTTNYLQALTENAIKKKQADFAFFEKNVGSALANIKKTDGILPEDAPYINTKKKELFKYIVDNIDAFAPNAVLKNPEKVTEVDSRIAEYLSDVDASKQWKKAFVDEGYKQMLRKPDQNNEVNIARYNEMIKTPLKERQPFVPISDGMDDFSKAMTVFYKDGSKQETIIKENPLDPGTTLTEQIFHFDEDAYKSLHKAHRGEYLTAYWNMHPEIHDQFNGDVDAFIYSKAPKFQDQKVSNRAIVPKTNVSYVEGQKTDRNDASIAGRKEVAKMNNETRRYAADLRASTEAQKLAVKGTYGSEVQTAFESIDNMVAEETFDIGSVDKGITGVAEIKVISPQSIPNQLSTKLYVGGVQANEGVYGNLYELKFENGNTMYAPGIQKYFIGDNEVTADRYKISTSAEKRIQSVPNAKKLYTKDQLAKEMMNTKAGLKQFTDYENAKKEKGDRYFKQNTPAETKPTFKHTNITGYVKEFEKEGYGIGSIDTGGHNAGSLHSKKLAVDLPASKNGGVEGLKKLLPALKAKYPELDIIDETTKPAGQSAWTGPHIHIEMDSKYASFPAETLPASAPAPKKTTKKDWSIYKRK